MMLIAYTTQQEDGYDVCLMHGCKPERRRPEPAGSDGVSGDSRTSEGKPVNIAEQLQPLMNAFECAVALGINEGEFQRPFCRLNEDFQYRLRTTWQSNLEAAWQNVGDISTLLEHWPIVNSVEVVSFYGTSGRSALEVIYRFTEKLAKGPLAFLPQYPEEWTQPKIRAEKERLLVRLRIEAEKAAGMKKLADEVLSGLRATERGVQAEVEGSPAPLSDGRASSRRFSACKAT